MLNTLSTKADFTCNFRSHKHSIATLGKQNILEQSLYDLEDSCNVKTGQNVYSELYIGVHIYFDDATVTVMSVGGDG